MPTLARYTPWLLLALLCGCAKQQLQGSYHCPNEVKFRFNRQSQTAQLIHGGQTEQAILEEKGLLTWPQHKGDFALPDSFAISRKDPKVLMLYGGFAGTGLACQKDAG
jgi:hypothetical protein